MDIGATTFAGVAGGAIGMWTGGVKPAGFLGGAIGGGVAAVVTDTLQDKGVNSWLAGVAGTAAGSAASAPLFLRTGGPVAAGLIPAALGAAIAGIAGD